MQKHFYRLTSVFLFLALLACAKSVPYVPGGPVLHALDQSGTVALFSADDDALHVLSSDLSERAVVSVKNNAYHFLAPGQSAVLLRDQATGQTRLLDLLSPGKSATLPIPAGESVLAGTLYVENTLAVLLGSGKILHFSLSSGYETAEKTFEGQIPLPGQESLSWARTLDQTSVVIGTAHQWSLYNMATGTWLARGATGEGPPVVDLVPLTERLFVSLNQGGFLHVWTLPEGSAEDAIATAHPFLEAPNEAFEMIQATSNTGWLLAVSRKGDPYAWSIAADGTIGNKHCTDKLAASAPLRAVLLSESGSDVATALGVYWNRVAPVTHTGVSWNLKKSSCLSKSFEGVSPVVAPDGRSFMTTVPGKKAQLFDVSEGVALGSLSQEGIVSSAFSSDGSRIVTTGSDGSVRWWTSADARLEKTIPPWFSAKRGSLQMHPSGDNDARYVAVFSSGSEGDVVRVWDTSTGAVVSHLDADPGEMFFDVAFSPTLDRWLVTSTTGIHVLPTNPEQAGAPKRVDVRHAWQKTSMYNARFSTDGKLIVGFAPYYLGIRVLDAASGAVLNDFFPAVKELSDILLSVSLSNDGKYILVGNDRALYMLDRSTGAKTTFLEFGKNCNCTYLYGSFSPDGRFVLGGCLEKQDMYLWDIADPKNFLLSFVTNGVKGRDLIVSAGFSPDGKLVHAVDDLGWIHSWEWNSIPSKSEEISKLPVAGLLTSNYTTSYQPLILPRFGFDAFGLPRYVSLGEADGSSNPSLASVRDLYPKKTYSSKAISVKLDKPATSTFLTPNGNEMLVLDKTRIRSYSTLSGDPGQMYTGHSGPVSQGLFSQDDNVVLSVAANPENALLWDRQTAAFRGYFPQSAAPVSWVVQSPEQTTPSLVFVRTVDASQTGLYEFPSGKQAWLYPDSVRASAIARAFFSNDGQWLFLVFPTLGEVEYWRVDRPTKVGTLSTPRVVSAALSPDGSRLLTSHNDGAVFLRDLSKNSSPVLISGWNPLQETPALDQLVWLSDGSGYLGTKQQQTWRTLFVAPTTVIGRPFDLPGAE